jgi:hypothetical protein
VPPVVELAENRQRVALLVIEPQQNSERVDAVASPEIIGNSVIL